MKNISPAQACAQEKSNTHNTRSALLLEVLFHLILVS
jgi:hypothetical protein